MRQRCGEGKADRKACCELLEGLCSNGEKKQEKVEGNSACWSCKCQFEVNIVLHTNKFDRGLRLAKSHHHCTPLKVLQSSLIDHVRIISAQRMNSAVVVGIEQETDHLTKCHFCLLLSTHNNWQLYPVHM